MKTTLVLRDDIVRRAKSRAALRGQALARYVEETLEKQLTADENRPSRALDWIRTLPDLPAGALKELQQVVDADDFREIDEEMWK